jgi:DNA-binding transcriptional ArsR family regulator
VGTDFAVVGRLLASPARSVVINALMDGRPLSAGELARLAGISASTMSEHLREMVDGHLLTAVTAGRHRYYQLASAEVAQALEALSLICPDTPVRSLAQSSAQRSLRTARFCYDHVAGVVGVALFQRMCALGWLDPIDGTDSAPGLEYQVTVAGLAALTGLGVDVEACRRARRHFARSCLDWTQRRAHLAGSLGAGVATALVDQKWLRPSGPGRGLAVTSQGEQSLRAVFGITLVDPQPPQRRK